jgi:hypothetical protein
MLAETPMVGSIDDMLTTIWYFSVDNKDRQWQYSWTTVGPNTI